MISQKNNSNKTILIVEDETPLSKVIEKKLNLEGFKTFKANNGLDGLKIAKLEKPDLILLDIVMPVMNGIKMLKELREDEWGKDVKVIILTNLTDATKEQELSQEGISDYLVKSDWKINDLISKIKQKLNS